jgi:hypothetical protein
MKQLLFIAATTLSCWIFCSAAALTDGFPDVTAGCVSDLDSCTAWDGNYTESVTSPLCPLCTLTVWTCLDSVDTTWMKM